MSDKDDSPPEHIPVYRELRLGAQLLLLALAGGAIYLGYQGRQWFYRNAKKHKRKAGTEREVLVELKTLVPTSKRITLRASGTVVPARELALQSQVGGVINKVHPHLQEGHRIEAGTTLIELDQQDFDLTVKMREAELAKRQAEYQLELGQQEIAKSELAAAGEGGHKLTAQERALIMREPQMAQIKASIASAEASLAEAKLNCTRTSIKVPFNALIRSKRVDTGTQIGTSTVIAELVGTDEFWIQVSVPVDELRWIQFPKSDQETGAAVRIAPTGGLQDGVVWNGHVLRLLPNLETSGRMAQVLISVKNPMTQNAELPLLLNSYVNVEIDGREVKNIFAVDRSVLHNGNQVWLRNMENRLVVRDVGIVWRSAETVLVDRGLAVGEHLIVSDIASPIPGMKLSAKGDKPKAKVAGDSPDGRSDGNASGSGKPVSMDRESGKPGNGNQHR